MYIGAAMQNWIASGSRPTFSAASRTTLIVQAAMSGSASCRMNPSPTSPVSCSASGPYAATQMSSVDPRDHGNCTLAPCRYAGRSFASSRITSIDWRRVARLDGLPCSVRTAESPRPIPQMVRLPYISLSVANSDAMTDQSRVAGLVTMGPTMTLRVAARIAE